MAVVVGSARSDERGKLSGGKAGSQTEREISKQNFYVHSKGWYVLRAKDPKVAEKIAKNMEYACDSLAVGYDQGQNTTLWKEAEKVGFDISKVKTPCETDCARLVRVCIKYSGIDVADFYTGNMKAVIMSTGKFELFTEDKYCKQEDFLKRGDILVTRTKGHTVVVLSNGSKVVSSSSAASTTTSGGNSNVKKGQEWLNDNYGTIIKKTTGKLLVVDGKYGSHSKWAALLVWKDLMNRKHGSSLTLSNKNFGDTCKKYASNAVVKKGTEGTFTYICQLILAANGCYTGKMDGKCGSGTVNAIKEFQKKKGLAQDGSCGKNTWDKLFN